VFIDGDSVETIIQQTHGGRDLTPYAP